MESTDSAATGLGTQLRSLLPADIAVSYSAACPPDAVLFEAELACTAGMVATRRHEFTHGRHCARLALAALGLPPAAIPKAADRAPVWPAGVIGSITHSAALAAAAAGHARRYAGIGIDIETAAPLDDATREMILLPAEFATANGQQAKLLFSIKEAIYKCIYPVVGGYVDFREMGVALEPAGSFRALPECNRFAADAIADLRGRYCVTPDWVLAAAWLATD